MEEVYRELVKKRTGKEIRIMSYLGFKIGNVTLSFGLLPNRKKEAVYLEENAAIRPLGYFNDNESFNKFMDLMEDLITGIEGKKLRLNGYQPIQDPGKIKPPKGGTGESGRGR